MVQNNTYIVAKNIRKKILDMALHCGNGGSHLGGSLSAVELLSVLYSEIIHFKADNPKWEERDRFILSKGHAAMALYATLAEVGIIEEEELKTFKSDGSRLSVHPSLNGLPGIEVASGSLGQGLSIGVGMSIALNMRGNSLSHIYVLLGDGECNEGSVWESATAATHFNCKNITAIIDANGLQYDGLTNEIMNMSPMKEKWIDFGWDVSVINGHDIDAIFEAFKRSTDKPKVIIAQTVKGKGVSFMENQPEYHYAMLTEELYNQAVDELRNGND